MNLGKIVGLAQQQMRDPKRRAQVEKLVGTAKSKIASRGRSGKPGDPSAPPKQDPLS
ncbi:MAG: hypothetical protein JWN61_53 [Pseudonocardiales bacterium]|nr:hypothetical protein [Jatrophihabitantaceae bacterium]MCW2601918.1 hypothetical protein [Pseudonocardiales bacterium]